MSLPHSPFLESIIRFLLPFFLGTGVDTGAAREEILETLASYGTRTRAELLTAAQIIAFGMSTLDMLSEAKATAMSGSMRLRFRGCANGLNRACKQNEQTLDKRLARDQPVPSDPPPQLANAQLANPEPANPEPSHDVTDAQAMEIIQQAQTRIETACNRLSGVRPASQPASAQPDANPTLTPVQRERNRQLWGAAMINVLNQMGMPVAPVQPTSPPSAA